MRRLKPSVVRWPGGCFADSYSWRDGVGPRAQRPRRANFWINDGFLAGAPDGPAKYEPNEFGTNEFMHFCRLIGAQPYLAANLRSNTARDFYEWVEYCNAPAGRTTLADQRASQGDAEPFNVRLWGVGNESWGCGGDFTPEEYAAEFRRFTAWVPGFGVPLAFIASGPNGGDLDWTRRFFTRVAERDRGILNSIYGWALHYYCGTSGNGSSIDFTTDDWYDLLGKAMRMETLIRDHWAAMGQVDREHRVKLVVDEWGAWHRPGHGSGTVASVWPDLLHARCADRRPHARHLQPACGQGGDGQRGPAHQQPAFALPGPRRQIRCYAQFPRVRDVCRALRRAFAEDTVRCSSNRGRTAALPILAGSASLHDRRLVLSVANTHATEPVEAEIRIRGANLKGGRGRVLTGPDIHAHNTFAQPRAVEPRDVELKIGGGANTHQFPPASVTRLELDLSSAGPRPLPPTSVGNGRHDGAIHGEGRAAVIDGSGLELLEFRQFFRG